MWRGSPTELSSCSPFAATAPGHGGAFAHLLEAAAPVLRARLRGGVGFGPRRCVRGRAAILFGRRRDPPPPRREGRRVQLLMRSSPHRDDRWPRPARRTPQPPPMVYVRKIDVEGPGQRRPPLPRLRGLRHSKEL